MCRKANRLEIWNLVDSNLVLVHSRVVHGTISMLQKLQPKDSPTELLFVGTDRFQYFSVAWNTSTNQLDTIDDFHDVGEKHMRDSQSQDKCLVDPSGKYMAMLLWEGVLSILRLRSRKGLTMKLDWMEQIRMAEMFIKGSTFLHSETHPKIAFLYQTRSDSADTKLATYRLTEDDRDSKASRFDPLKDREISMDIEDPGAAMLIPVERVEDEKRHNVRNPSLAKAQLGGLLVIGESQVVYIDDVTQRVVESGLKAATIFVAWTKYDTTHYILADDYGVLHLLTILTEGVVVTSVDVTPIGKTSRASCLVYLGNDILFVGSHYGDSQVFRLHFDSQASSLIELVKVMPNIGPILDFSIMDMGNREDDSQLANEYSSGQARIVTGSGVHKDGTLRSVRSGVGLEDIGILADLPDVQNLLSIRSPGSSKVDTLVASFLTETRVFKFDPNGEIEEVEALGGLDFGSQTLLAANLPGGRLLQVTTEAATLTEADSGVAVATWRPDENRRITSASANNRWVLLSVEGTILISLNIENELRQAGRKEVDATSQVACVHASPQLLDVGAVGFWTTGSISILELATLQPVHGESVRRKEDNVSIPRDLMLAQVLPPQVGGPTLFVSMDDGNIVTFNVSKKDLTLSGRKSVVLGTREARFHPLPQEDGTYNVFATTEHPSLIYGSEGRIVYSAVTAEDATCVCPFDTEAFPGAIAVATDSQIKISQIDTERRTHVRSLEMGETIRRIAYSPSERVFGLGCIKRELIQGEEYITSSFRLVDEVIFDKLGKPFELEAATSTEIVECVVRAELPDCHENPAERFVVGTSILAQENVASPDEEIRGRILVLGVDSDRSPYLITSHPLKGACRCLAVMEDKIVAGLTKTVVLSRYEEETSTSGRLHRIASYRPSTYPVDITVHGNMIAVADLMKSISLVEYMPSEEDRPAQLVEQSRHYHSAWATAVSTLR